MEGDLSEEWSDPFSTMFSPSWLCGVGERERLRRTGEQAGVLLFELLAVLKKEKRTEMKRKVGGNHSPIHSSVIYSNARAEIPDINRISVDSSTTYKLFSTYIT